MCGIAGFILTRRVPDAESRLRAMADSIRHRGPDGEGLFLDGTGDGTTLVGLAHRRLAIIDLATGTQPMVHQSAGVTLIYNGEIYNFDLLRLELEALGHRFRLPPSAAIGLRPDSGRVASRGLRKVIPRFKYAMLC